MGAKWSHLGGPRSRTVDEAIKEEDNEAKS